MSSMASMIAPQSALLAWALLIAALCWVTFQNWHMSAAMLLAFGLLTATNLLIGTTRLADEFSTHPIADRLRRAQSGGLAYIGPLYHAEFNIMPSSTLQHG